MLLKYTHTPTHLEQKARKGFTFKKLFHNTKYVLSEWK